MFAGKRDDFLSLCKRNHFYLPYRVEIVLDQSVHGQTSPYMTRIVGARVPRDCNFSQIPFGFYLGLVSGSGSVVIYALVKCSHVAWPWERRRGVCETDLMFDHIWLLEPPGQIPPVQDLNIWPVTRALIK